MKQIQIQLLSGILLFGVSPCALTGGVSDSHEILAPLDESNKEPSLGPFLERLRVAVKERDADFVQSILSSDVILGFGPQENSAEAMSLSLSDFSSSFWQSLESSIFYGGTFINEKENGAFCMPYFYSEFPSYLDPVEYQVVVTPSVDARTEPNSASTLVPLPDYAVLKTDIGSAITTNDADGVEWARIYVGGDTAYVPSAAIRSPLESRTCLRKKGDHWCITAVVAGD